MHASFSQISWKEQNKKKSISRVLKSKSMVMLSLIIQIRWNEIPSHLMCAPNFWKLRETLDLVTDPYFEKCPSAAAPITSSVMLWRVTSSSSPLATLSVSIITFSQPTWNSRILRSSCREHCSIENCKVLQLIHEGGRSQRVATIKGCRRVHLYILPGAFCYQNIRI